MKNGTLCDVYCEVPWISLCRSIGHVCRVQGFVSFSSHRPLPERYKVSFQIGGCAISNNRGAQARAVFEPQTTTGKELFSYSNCLHTIILILLGASHEETGLVWKSGRDHCPDMRNVNCRFSRSRLKHVVFLSTLSSQVTLIAVFSCKRSTYTLATVIAGSVRTLSAIFARIAFTFINIWWKISKHQCLTLEIALV